MNEASKAPGHSLPQGVKGHYKRAETIEGIREWTRNKDDIAVTHRCRKVHNFKLVDGEWKRVS